MEDPFSTYTDQEDSDNSGIPTWVWAVGGLAFGSGCCLFLIIGVLAFAQLQLESCFGDVTGVLEERADETAATRTADGNGSEDGDIFGAVDGIFQRDETVQRPQFEPYDADFNEPLGWATGAVNDADGTAEAEVLLEDGLMLFAVYADSGLYWSTAGEYFANGRYQVEATAVSGTLDNGFGMILMVDDSADDFYMFEISSDGFVWIGYYDNGGELIEPLTGKGWFVSEAVNQGLGEANVLSATAEDGDWQFFVNDVSVAQVSDSRLLEGDVGVFVEALGEGDIVISFDNFTFQPTE